ncbi:MAG: hypothetical protein DMF97_01360 [Acidobacteria bacterium]|nr:MAG: hypothetical protein DMF97_01360 [Acidobacteriota bacterium]
MMSVVAAMTNTTARASGRAHIRAAVRNDSISPRARDHANETACCSTNANAHQAMNSRWKKCRTSN